jgi:hypothetical protein
MQHVKRAQGEVRAYELKYGVTYQVFERKIQTDAGFLRWVESQNPLWEEDAIEWRIRAEEVPDTMAIQPARRKPANHKSKIANHK